MNVAARKYPSGTGNKKSQLAKWEEAQAENRRLKRLAEVRSVVQTSRPPRPQGQGQQGQGQGLSRQPSHESGSRGSTPPLHLWKPRARSASPGRQLEPLEPSAAPGVGPPLRPPVAPGTQFEAPPLPPRAVPQPRGACIPSARRHRAVSSDAASARHRPQPPAAAPPSARREGRPGSPCQAMQLPSPRRRSSPAGAAQAFLAAELLPSPQATETAQPSEEPVPLLPAAVEDKHPSPQGVDCAPQSAGTTDAKSMEEWLQEAKKMVAALTPKSDGTTAVPAQKISGELPPENMAASVLSATEMQVARDTGAGALPSEEAHAQPEEAPQPQEDAEPPSVEKSNPYLENDFEEQAEEDAEVGADHPATNSEQQPLLSPTVAKKASGSVPVGDSETEEPSSALQTSMKRTLGASATIASYADDFEDLDDAEEDNSEDEE
mmetsp:Transcript_30029/g.54726  ORF Transcript_30029/g.54726 Transcript_30029/m.54726 type:complete len:435 (-) Transcript_30029:86-1390(-)